MNILSTRHQTLKTIRQHLDEQGFLEVDAPLLIPANAVEAYIDPVPAKLRLGPDQKPLDYFLHTSPEVYLKRLLCHGAKNIYYLGHVFRDGELGVLHRPEFLMLEWYRVQEGLESLIRDCEYILEALQQTLLLPLRNLTPFNVYDMETLWKDLGKVDLRKALESQQTDPNALVAYVKEAGYALRPKADFFDAFTQVMMQAIEPFIGKEKPCVVQNWPSQMASLAQKDTNDPLFAKRFEIYAGGLELCNAFLELQDPKEQEDRFLADQALRVQEGRSFLPLPKPFLADLKNLPQSAGAALGIDRVLMYLLGQKSIEKVYPFDFMKERPK